MKFKDYLDSLNYIKLRKDTNPTYDDIKPIYTNKEKDAEYLESLQGGKKMKIGDKVKFKDEYHEGVGVIVAKDGIGGYLVHSKGLKGHNAKDTTVEQDNYNNWWFKEKELKKIEERKQGMNKHLIERFKNGEIAINLETQQEWNEFMQWLEENTDLRWNTGHKPTEKNYWNVDKEWTCVDSNMAWSAYNSYEGSGYEIIKYKDLKEGKGMKTTEFIKRVEELGYTFEDGVGFEIYYNSRIVARVFKMHESVVDTSFDAFRHLDNAHKAELLDLMVEYAKTPLEEREEEKKYYWKLKGGPQMDSGYTYFNYNPKTSTWNLDNASDYSISQTLFSEKEFASLKEILGIDLEFEKEEVE